MDAQLMKKYIDYVKKQLEINNTSTIMIYNSFKGHLEKSVKTKFHDKNNLRKEWHIWMAEGGTGTTTSENLRYARLFDICG
ncbi:hypothetical protein RclHR1_05560003 [Rhizophagus clarus]|uniref:DDE-1 domain-containing protein n=1 Tax=Rhizophagus clarus TaxID=94130 RepID=A0A2Z6RTN8_9GLOM|nr:hypothetical protein RclHR1_05560003 [Rhizophagus clarus]